MSILCRGISSQLLSLFWYCICAIRSHPRTRNKFFEIVAVAECYLISNHVKNKESKKQPFQICLPVKLADGRMSMKKEKRFLPNLQHFQFRQSGWKTFFMKISGIWTCSQIFRKFRYWEKNAAILNNITWSICSCFDFGWKYLHEKELLDNSLPIQSQQ